jgi:hypothetical protein
MIHGIFQLAIFPKPFNKLIPQLKLSLSMFLTILPLAPEYLSIGKEEHTLAMLEPIKILTFITVAIGPGEHTEPFNQSILPLTIVLPIINIGEDTIAMEVAVGELALVDAWVADIVPKSWLDAVEKLSLVVGTVLELLFPLAVGDVVFPLPVVLVALVGVVVDALAVGFIILDLSLVHAAVVIAIPTLTMRNPL